MVKKAKMHIFKLLNTTMALTKKVNMPKSDICKYWVNTLYKYVSREKM